MAEESAASEAVQSPEPEKSQEQTVPYERFAEVNKKAQDTQNELKDLQERLQEIEDRDKSELERERTQRERLQQELQDREQRLVKAERGSWVRAAAQEAKFVDPEDAVALVNLSGIESERDAEKAVKKIAERKEHLIQNENATPPIGRVLEGGQPASAQKAQTDEENEKFLAELRAASRSGWTSTPGLVE